MKTVLMLTVASALLAACSSTPPAVQSPVDDLTIAVAKPLPASEALSAMGNLGKSGPYPPRGEGGALGERSIHYDFNQFTVPDQALPIIAAHGRFLLNHPDAFVRLQGNCDERGSREYNLGLGQRRADGVRKILAAQGVPDSQMVAVSFGAEKPRNPAHGESAWAENRRTDIVYQGESSANP
jgi:peptidoglycan-associated lipoprotein